MNNIQAQPAQMSGEARRISAAEKAEMELKARPAVLKAVIQVTRAATGKVEEYTLTGYAEKEDQ